MACLFVRAEDYRCEFPCRVRTTLIDKFRATVTGWFDSDEAVGWYAMVRIGNSREQRYALDFSDENTAFIYRMKFG